MQIPEKGGYFTLEKVLEPPRRQARKIAIAKRRYTPWVMVLFVVVWLYLGALGVLAVCIGF